MKLKKYLFKKVYSTNSTALRLIRHEYSNGAILSDEQSKGRGQSNNKWISLKGNLFMSIFFKISKKLTLKKLTNLNLSIIKKIITKIVNGKIEVKMPNDILVNEKKVCGILQETTFKNNIKFLVIGIGINVVNSPMKIKYETTYLNKYSKKKINKIKLFKEIKLNFEKKIKLFR